MILFEKLVALTQQDAAITSTIILIKRVQDSTASATGEPQQQRQQHIYTIVNQGFSTTITNGGE